MKKLFAFALTLGLALGMTSCGDGSGDYEAFTLEGTIVDLPPNENFELVLSYGADIRADYDLIYSDSHGRANFSLVLPNYLSWDNLDPTQNFEGTILPTQFLNSAGDTGYVEPLMGQALLSIVNTNPNLNGSVLYGKAGTSGDTTYRTLGTLVYSNCDLRGQDSDTGLTFENSYDLNIREGWNWIYDITEILDDGTLDEYNINRITTKNPGGLYFEFTQN